MNDERGTRSEEGKTAKDAKSAKWSESGHFAICCLQSEMTLTSLLRFALLPILLTDGVLGTTLRQE